MKKLLTLFAILMISVFAFAQNPKLSYQAVVRDSQNKLVVEQPVTITVNVLNAANESQFSQTLNATTNRNGLMSLEIGDETNAWKNINWSGAKIRTAVAFNDTEMVDTTIVNAVPSALYAERVALNAIPQSNWAETDNTQCTFILNKPSITDTVNNILTTGQYVTVPVMDARGYLTSDSAVITTMRDSIQINAANIATNATNIATNAGNITTNANNIASAVSKEQADSTTLAARMDALEGAAMNCASVKACISDTLNQYTTTDQLCNVVNSCDLTGNSALMELLNAMNDKINKLDSIIDQQDSIINTLKNPSGCGAFKVKDHQGNIYNTVKIGEQCWTKENMRCTTSPNTGNTILETTPSSYSYVGKKAYYTNGNADNTEIYGLLYNWCAAVDTFNTAYTETETNTGTNIAPSIEFNGNRRGICPQGWHIPSDDEWSTLTDFLYFQDDFYSEGCTGEYDEYITSCIAKSMADTRAWAASTTNYTPGNNLSSNNATGFSAVPAGTYFGEYDYFSTSAGFWSTTQHNSVPSTAYYRNMSNKGTHVGRNATTKCSGFSVRCLRDAGISESLGDNESYYFPPATMSCDDVMNCVGDTLGKLNAKIVDLNTTVGTLNSTVSSQGQTITEQGNTIDNLNTTVSSQSATIDSLAHLVDSLSQLPHGGGNTPSAIFFCDSSIVKDAENNEYRTVTIGNQCWMKQNLRTKNINGIGRVWTNPNVDSVTYGRYYDWEAVMQVEGVTDGDYIAGDKHRGICPVGWHVPSNAEWRILTNYVNSKAEYQCNGTPNAIANALSAATGWNESVNCCAGDGSKLTINKTGFSAVPAAYYFSHEGNNPSFGNVAFFWSANQSSSINAYIEGLRYDESGVFNTSFSKADGAPVRCLRDAGVVGPAGSNESGIGGGDTSSTPATMSCDDVMNCLGDTLGKLNAKIEAQNGRINTLESTVSAQGNSISNLNHIVDSLGGIINSMAAPADGQPCSGTPTVSDADGNIYNTVKIGNQCWMKENLRTSTSLGNAYAPDDSEGNVSKYGLLYDWEAVMQGASSSEAVPSGVRGICPEGWHVPSNAEWDTLTKYTFDNYKYAGCTSEWNTEEPTYCIAKALASTLGWIGGTAGNYNANSTDGDKNATGFSAVPAGGYHSSTPQNFGYTAFFWSVTQPIDGVAYSRTINGDEERVHLSSINTNAGISVRCLRDESSDNGNGNDTPEGGADGSADLR